MLPPKGQQEQANPVQPKGVPQDDLDGLEDTAPTGDFWAGSVLLGRIQRGCVGAAEYEVLRQEVLERAEGMERGLEGEEHDFREQRNRHGLRLAQGAGDFILKELGDRPQDGADDRAEERHVAQHLGFNPRVDLALEATVPRYSSRMPVERMSKSSERMIPLVMLKEQVPAVARLLPRPGTMC